MRSTLLALERGGAWRLAAFTGLSALAAWRYAGTEARPPTARVVAIAATAILAATAVILIRAREAATRRARVNAAVARVVALFLLFGVAVLAAGVPGHLLRPSGWRRLAHAAGGGLNALSTTLWPYAGSDSWARLDILLALAAVPLVAAGLAFWPARSGHWTGPAVYGARQLGALALLLTLYVVGVLDSNRGSAATDGLLLLALVVAWLWLPGMRARRVAPALAWLAGLGALAAVVTGQLAGSQPWLNYRAWNLLGTAAPSTAFSWNQTYGPITWSRSNRTMFTVSAARPQLWKVTTLDRFDGLRFVRSASDASSYEDLPLGMNVRWYGSATFNIQGLSSGELPTGQGSTVGVDFNRGIRHDGDGTVGTVGAKLRDGDTYTVMSYTPNPTPAELKAIPRAFPPSYLRYTEFDLPGPSQSGLRLPVSEPPPPGRLVSNRSLGAGAPGPAVSAAPRWRQRILASPYRQMYLLARRLASGLHSTYDITTAVETYLKANYLYSEQPPLRQYPLESFLFRDRAGYCQQFSGAMTLMLRMDGIPSRVAAGFLPGTFDPATRKFDVRAVDAHSWVEVYFTGLGWVSFDPTPPRPVGRVPRFPSERTVNVRDAIAATVGSLPQYVGRRIPTAQRRTTRGSASDGRAALIAAALVGLLVLVALVGRWLSGHARLRRSLVGDGELATVELARALRRLGYAVPATITLAQIERLVRIHGGPDAARYAQLLRERRYAENGSAPATMRDRRRLRHGLTAHLGLDVRLRGHLALPPSTLAWWLPRGRGPSRSA